jgi:hypothetical protein
MAAFCGSDRRSPSGELGMYPEYAIRRSKQGAIVPSRDASENVGQIKWEKAAKIYSII